MDMNYTLELIDEAKIFLELYRDMLSPFSLDDNDRKSVHYHVVIEETDELVDIYPGKRKRHLLFSMRLILFKNLMVMLLEVV